MDCLEYLKKLPDNCVDLVVTDPPYNVSTRQDMKWQGRPIKRNFGEWDFGFDPEPVLAELKRVLKPHGQIYVFCSTAQIPQYRCIFERNWFFHNLFKLALCQRHSHRTAWRGFLGFPELYHVGVH
ncbi:MAG: DNA methyltransferase [Nanoarchaeota archaeon]